MQFTDSFGLKWGGGGIYGARPANNVYLSAGGGYFCVCIRAGMREEI